MPHFGKTHDFRAMFWRAAMVSDPVRKGWWGYGLVFDRIYRINRIEGRGKERGRRGNHAESAEGRGNSDWWQGYANAPPMWR